MATKNTNTQKRQSAESAAQDSAEKKAVVFTPKAFDLNQIVTVRNGFQGRLVYKSKKTGEVFIWEEFGAEQDMELAELKSARSSSKKFFINNWFVIDDPEVIDVGSRILRAHVVVLPMATVTIIANMLFQSCGSGAFSENLTNPLPRQRTAAYCQKDMAFRSRLSEPYYVLYQFKK